MVSWDPTKDMSDQTGKVAIVTGGNTGIGKATVEQLAIHGAKVYMASRTESRALAAIAELEDKHPEIKQRGAIVFLKLNLSSLESCVAAAQTFLEMEERLDILINNAGIMGFPYELSEDGIENQFQSNHLGHFAFTIILLPLLIQTSKDPNASVRIVQVSSYGHQMATKEMTFDSVESINQNYKTSLQRYGQSKLANILFANELARRLSNERIFSNSINPGNVNTELPRGLNQRYSWAVRPTMALLSVFLATPLQGAIPSLYTATAREVEENRWSGEYFVPPAKLSKPTSQGEDPQLARNLWDLSMKILKDKTGYDGTL